ncbi:MAG: domain protein family protein [Verrucomicrobiales bacterium]|nr:domain protein family protein [Verrucomicrobiales bacterium]
MTRNALFLPDANIWLNALNQSSRDHAVCRQWLDQATSTGQDLLVNDLTECALLRIGTHPQLGISTPTVALAFHKALLDYPQTRRCSPADRHHQILSGFLTGLGLVGNDVNDAWLAALAVEHHATLVSLDEGFSRFPGLLWHNPAASA